MIDNLKHSLQALALPASDQLRLFPPFVCVPDELALNFAHWLECVEESADLELTSNQIGMLRSIDQILEQMSGPEHAEFWNQKSLETHPLWATVRSMAVKALESLGWDTEPPPPYTSEYYRVS